MHTGVAPLSCVHLLVPSIQKKNLLVPCLVGSLPLFIEETAHIFFLIASYESHLSFVICSFKGSLYFLVVSLMRAIWLGNNRLIRVQSTGMSTYRQGCHGIWK